MKALWVMLLALASAPAAERVLTHARAGHLIHNSQVFSRDGRFVVFDSRNDETQLAGSTRIGVVEIATGRERTLYETPRSSAYGPGVGAACFSPASDEVVFIHGLDSASSSSPYAPQRRSAALVSLDSPGGMSRLDARDVTAPFTPGALRGGTHAHHWSGDGEWLSCTYNDAVVASPGPAPEDLRTVGVICRKHAVQVDDAVPGEEFSGSAFAVVVVPVAAGSGPGVPFRACEEGWVGTNGYLRADGSRQKRALAFIGTIRGKDGRALSEVFIADLPDDLTRPGRGPLEGDVENLPAPPAGVSIRRLTDTENTARPGLQGPRHWLRSSPDGSAIGFLDEDAGGIVQLFVISPRGGEPRQVSRLDHSIETPFTWSPDGKRVAASAGGRIVTIDVTDGEASYLTEPSTPGSSPCHGVVFSPDGESIAFNRMLPHPEGGRFLQVCIVPSASTAKTASGGGPLFRH